MKQLKTSMYVFELEGRRPCLALGHDKVYWTDEGDQFQLLMMLDDVNNYEVRMSSHSNNFVFD